MTRKIIGVWETVACENKTIDECMVAEKSSVAKAAIQSVLNFTMADAYSPLFYAGAQPSGVVLVPNSEPACSETFFQFFVAKRDLN